MESNRLMKEAEYQSLVDFDEAFCSEASKDTI